MIKKTKLILSGLGATAGISIIPLAVVACSSTIAKVSTKDTSNLTEKGFLLNIIPLELTIKEIPLEGLPNENGLSTLERLDKYISVTDSLTGDSLPESTIVSDINFTNGDTTNAAKINFSLGVKGSFSLVAVQKGAVTKDTKYSWTFHFPDFSTGNDLSKFLDGLQNTSLDFANVILNSANTSNSFNDNGIQQYIWFSNLSNNEQKENFGVLVGTWSIENKAWKWNYNLNRNNQITPNSDLSASGVPSDVTSLDQLAKWIDFLPQLNQFSISKDATVSISLVSNDTQIITIEDANNNIEINGKFVNNYWVYTFINKATIYAQMKDYINKINKSKLSLSSRSSLVLPSWINEKNINENINNLPNQPSDTTITYNLVSDDITGKLSIVVNISAKDQPTLSSEPQEVTGFLTIQELVQNYIDSINKTKLTTTSIASQHLPTEVNEENIKTFIANLPTLPPGVALNYVLKPNDTTGLLDITISASAKDATIVVANQQILSGFLTSQQQAVNNYITLVNQAIFSANEIGAKLLSTDQKITNETLETYIKGLPKIPDGIKISFNINQETNGSLSFSISATLNGTKATSETKTATGFLTAQQQAINEYIAQVNEANIIASAKGAKLLSSDQAITNETLESYIKDLPQPDQGISIIFTIDSRADGSITFKVNATFNSATATSEAKTASGFLTTQQKAINDYITQVNEATITANTQGAKLLSTDQAITDETLKNYIDGIPNEPEGITINFKISERADGSLIFSVNATLNGASATSEAKVAKGFLTSQQKVINDYIAKVNKANISANEVGAKLLTSDSAITNENLVNYIKDLPQTVDGIKISLTIDSRTNGSLSFKVTATLDGLTVTSDSKTALGFLTTQQQAVNNYITEVNSAKISADAEGAKLLSTDSKITNQSLQSYLSGLPEVPKDITADFKIMKQSNGSLTFTVTASLDEIKATSEAKKVEGFLTTEQQEVNNYIALVNAATVSANEEGSKLLTTDSTISNETLKNYIKNLPQPTDGITISYAITRTENGYLTFILTATKEEASANSQSKVVIGFLTTQQQAVNDYINSLNSIKLTATSAASQALPSEINEQNIDQYITNLPHIPEGVTLSYNLKADDAKGDLEITISASAEKATSLVAKAQKVSGFLTINQQAVNNYIAEVNKATIVANSDGAKLFATDTAKITNDNLSTLISGMPQNTGNLTLTFNISARADGSLTFSVTATLDGASATSEVKTTEGFFTNQQAVDQYINQVNEVTIAANEEGAKFLSNDVVITDQSLTNYIKNLPTPINWITVSFKIISRENGRLTFSVTATLNGSTATSEDKVVDGFLTTQQQAVNNYIKEFNDVNISINEEGKKLLATNTTGVTDSNLNTLISGIPNNTQTITLTFNILTRTDGSLTFTLTASLEGASTTSTSKSLNGFLTNQQAVDNYINQFNNAIITINEKGKELPSINTLEVNNNNLESLISGVPVTTQGISLSFNISARTDGSLTFNVNAQVNGASKTSNGKTIDGFLKLLDYIKNLNLKPNANFAPPQNTSNYVSFADSGKIFANFDLTVEQIKKIAATQNLYMKVSSFNLSQGTATLELFIRNGNYYQPAGQINYTGFYKGNSSGVQTSVENYFKDNNNVAKWLNIYLNINPSWLTNIFTVNSQSSNGAFFWGYNISQSSLNKIVFNDISITNVNNVITIDAIMPNPISYEEWDENTKKFVNNGLITQANAKVSIQLPFIFQTTGHKDTQIISTISTNSAGQTTISWNPDINGFSIDNSKYIFKSGNIQAPFRLKARGLVEEVQIPILVNSIIF